ncbi:sulfite exporter TauE/SafE family protein [Pseudomonas sp. JQ170]|uniref:sulfite exporter TauE/SafE family protein n=1 Tax=unclassified Pseudomonas TaxID=196821 RepID=UPI000FA9C34F|nr:MULTISPECIES: sulfite exporter TauE/SafE family protein [unclassified Pseudomonas]MDN7139544.1 sulfite exporter TauE/SafE family protein [Pseudomonas sp. JQ170]WRO77139.1 sulfite exporter TauE/SafE family protein [Pseudomonas sp. 170C]
MLSTLLAQLPFSAFDWVFIALGTGAAYIVFGIAGFGTALVAGPVLIHFLPLAQIIPLLVLLDFVAAFGKWLPSRKAVVRTELMRLLPCMVLGCSLGVVFLLRLKSQLLLLLMGVFVSAYALYSLAVKARPERLSAGWSVPAGVAGGLFGALFGSGGFLYALYLNARVASVEQARATQSALISCSTVVRLGLFLLAGVYADGALLLLALLLAPMMAAGLWLARRLTLNMSRETFVRLVTWLVLCSGIALIGRYLSEVNWRL